MSVTMVASPSLWFSETRWADLKASMIINASHPKTGTARAEC